MPGRLPLVHSESSRMTYILDRVLQNADVGYLVSNHHAFSFSLFSPTKRPASSKMRKSSRESLLPSPKPAPSTSLPEPPSSAPPATRGRRASNHTFTLSTILSEQPSLSYPWSPMHRASHSAPSLLSPTEPARQSSMVLPPDSSEQSYLLFSPTSPTAPSFSSHRAVPPSISAPRVGPTSHGSLSPPPARIRRG